MRLVGAALFFVIWFGCALAEEVGEPPAFSAKKSPLEILLVARRPLSAPLRPGTGHDIRGCCRDLHQGKVAGRAQGQGCRARDSSRPNAEVEGQTYNGDYRHRRARRHQGQDPRREGRVPESSGAGQEVLRMGDRATCLWGDGLAVRGFAGIVNHWGDEGSA